MNKVPFSENSEAEVVTWCYVITLTAKTQLTDLAAVNLTAIGQRVKTCARVLAGEAARLPGKFFLLTGETGQDAVREN